MEREYKRGSYGEKELEGDSCKGMGGQEKKKHEREGKGNGGMGQMRRGI